VSEIRRQITETDNRIQIADIKGMRYLRTEYEGRAKKNPGDENNPMLSPPSLALSTFPLGQSEAIH
jgi:hypothetical protein